MLAYELDLVGPNKEQKTAAVIDVAIPSDSNIMSMSVMDFKRNSRGYGK